VTSRVISEVELAIKPESVALGAFGAIAALFALVLGVQAISRQLRWANEDRRVLRALGAAPVEAASDGLIGVLGAVVLAQSWRLWSRWCSRLSALSGRCARLLRPGNCLRLDASPTSSRHERRQASC
jgi:hypothetical protein